MSTTTAPKATRTHLYEIDVVRILTFVCVIGVHTISHTAGPADVPLFVLLGLLHFTRNVFFALTAFVLVFTYLRRPVPMRKFWPRRFLLVGVPYLAWSVIYFLATTIHSGTSSSPGELVLKLLFQIVTGTAWYHLYFLLVTMQVYLLLPVILWVVRVTRRHHILLLSLSGAVQLVLTACYFYWPETTSWINAYNKQYFFSYQFFILAGAVAADHSTTFLEWVRSHRPLIGALSAVTAAVTIGVFLTQMAVGKTFYGAGAPLQPIIMVWGTAVSLGFLALGTWWADHRREGGRATRFVVLASDRSFGVFLSHPFVIWLLLWVGNDFFERVIPTPWLSLVLYVLVVIGAVIITELARRSPLSLLLTGRRFRSPAGG
jgi:peptidoglycan/LPS O-acetylase OafA/YrhL